MDLLSISDSLFSSMHSLLCLSLSTGELGRHFLLMLQLLQNLGTYSRFITHHIRTHDFHAHRHTHNHARTPYLIQGLAGLIHQHLGGLQLLRVALRCIDKVVWQTRVLEEKVL